MKFEKKIPSLQRKLYKEILNEIKRLDTSGDSLKVTVKNLAILTSIKGKVNRLVLNKSYQKEVKEFIKTFNSVYKLQTDYWQSIETKFKPRPLLKAVRNQAIQDTWAQLTTQGISQNVGDAIINILRVNITSGGSYASLTEQLRESLLNTGQGKGILDRYLKQVTSDSINQFNRQYTRIVSNDLGYVWYRYMNTDIETTRCFCDAMTDKGYFHISEVPDLLKGEGLICDGEKVKIYPKTKLPYGMIEGTNADNFFIRAGGYNCRHSIQPVAERQVPQNIRDLLYSSTKYKSWQKLNG